MIGIYVEGLKTVAEYHIAAQDMKKTAPVLRAGDSVYLSGVIYTARDAAHKRMIELMNQGKPFPFMMDGAIIYYAGPTPAREGASIGSCGPTTSARMDSFAPVLLKHGLSCMIGKGERSQDVAEAMRAYGAVYLAAIGGAGALIAQSVCKAEVIAFEELGCESIKRLTVQDFPAIVAMDSVGGNMYRSARSRYAVREVGSP